MGQRARPFSLDFSGFYQGQERMAEAGRLRGEGKAALGRGIGSGLAAVGALVERRRSEKREDVKRKEELDYRRSRDALVDAQRAESLAAEREDRQLRRDVDLYKIYGSKIEAGVAGLADAEYIAAKTGAAPDVSVLTQDLQKWQSYMSVLEGRILQSSQRSAAAPASAGAVAGASPAKGKT